MSNTVFDFQVVAPFNYDEMHDTTQVRGNEGVVVSRPEAGSYGIYRVSFDIHLPGPGIETQTERTTAEWLAFLRTVQGAYDTWLWKEPLAEFLYKVLTTDTDGQLGNGTGSLLSFSLAHRYLDASTLKVYVNAVLQTLTTHYTLEDNNTATPTILFVTAPGSGLAVTVEYEFRYPARFVTDPAAGNWRRAGTSFRTSVSIEEDFAGAHRV